MIEVDELEKTRLGVSPVGAVKVTVAPGTRFPPVSVTVAINGLANAVPIVALWPFPLANAMCAGAPGVFVRVKVADALPAVAVTVYEPILLFAVNVPAPAMPDPLVAIWIVLVELENVPLCPLLPVLAVKVTVYEGMATELASFTVTDRPVANPVSIAADWLLPAVTVTLAGTWITVAVSVLLTAAVPRLV